MAAEPPPLRRLQVRMAEATRVAGKPQYVVEKDYALGYLLAGISRVELLRKALVFKGGTCLRKAYFPGYRFSEDLDFTARSPLSCEELLTALNEAAEHMRALLDPIGPFSIEVEEEQHREPHPQPVRLPPAHPVPLDAHTWLQPQGRGLGPGAPVGRLKRPAADPRVSR